MKQQPLLTHGQLVDWLIYHMPLIDDDNEYYPFKLIYRPISKKTPLTGIAVCQSDPWTAYDQMVRRIQWDPIIHREITDLYWYWTL